MIAMPMFPIPSVASMRVVSAGMVGFTRRVGITTAAIVADVRAVVDAIFMSFVVVVRPVVMGVMGTVDAVARFGKR
jgi:hypothetical protein